LQDLTLKAVISMLFLFFYFSFLRCT
jgi:hypothetical protein